MSQMYQMTHVHQRPWLFMVADTRHRGGHVFHVMTNHKKILDKFL